MRICFTMTHCSTVWSNLPGFMVGPVRGAALSAGLPLPKEGLTPSLFARTAARASYFSSKVVRRSLSKIDAALLPVILLLEGNEACLLLSWDEAGKSARLLFPIPGKGQWRASRDDIEARYSGIAIFARPHFRFDQRTPEMETTSQYTGSGGAFQDQLPVFRDVLAAAVLINLFALAMPLLP